MNKPLLFSFFAGIGVLDLGFEKTGFQPVFVNEYEKVFIEAYKYARKTIGIQEPKYGYMCGSIEKVLDKPYSQEFSGYLKHAKTFNAPVGFIGGPPCPDFSVGGKNKGSKGDNGRLTQVYANVISKYLPDFFVFENVKGLWKTKEHRTFYEKIKKQFKKSGYVLFERLINTLEYGVPQDRERIILIGFNKKSKYFKNMDNVNFPWNDYILYPKDTIEKIIWPAEDPLSIKRTSPKNIIKELTVEYAFLSNNVKKHPNQKCCFIPRSALPKFKTISEGDVKKKSFKRLHRWRYSPTAAYGNNEVHIHPYKPRRISVAEALAIQSLPKEFVLPANMSLTAMFKSVGNAVPFKASEAIAKTILKFVYSLNESNSAKSCKSRK